MGDKVLKALTALRESLKSVPDFLREVEHAVLAGAMLAGTLAFCWPLYKEAANQVLIVIRIIWP